MFYVWLNNKFLNIYLRQIHYKKIDSLTKQYEYFHLHD
jgi:hypothetical protein